MEYKHLSKDERCLIGVLRVAGYSHRAIAGELGRSPSTICREVERNRYPSNGYYIAFHADSMGVARRRRARRGSQFSPAEWSRV